MTAIAKIETAGVDFQASISHAMAYVRSIQPEELDDAKKRIDLAKEWARIQKVARDVRVDIALLEIAYLRRVVELDQKKVLSKTYQGVAAYWAAQPEEELRSLIEEHIDATSSVKTMKEWLEFGAERRANYTYVSTGEFFHRQQARDDFETEAGRTVPAWEAERVDEFTHEIDRVLGSILNRWSADREGGFSIRELAETVGEDLAIDSRWSSWPGVHEAIVALCREAVLKTPSLLVKGTRLPAFITCIDRQSEGPGVAEGNWIRVPIEFATLGQLADMVALRKRQADDARRSADRVENLFDDLMSALAGDAEPLAALVTEAVDRVTESEVA